MENFLTQFKNESKEVKQISSEIKVVPEFHGSVNLSKGLLTFKIEFYARLYSIYGRQDLLRLDDWEVNSIEDVQFNGLVVDDLDALVKMMVSSGLKTLASDLKITNEELKSYISKAINDCSFFKKIYGKKAIVFDSLPDSEKNKFEIEWLIDTYEKRNQHELKKFSSNDAIPSKQDLEDILKTIIEKNESKEVKN